MPSRSERARPVALFLLRSLVLYFLLVNAWLQLNDQLSLPFQSAAFVIAVCVALWMERGRLRFLPALVVAGLLPFGLRALLFLVFRLQRAIASAPATDFLFFTFDKDFWAALVPWTVAWLFTFLALRHRFFVVIEAALSSLLLVAVFWTQAGYRVTIYPHPIYLAWVLALFVVAELFVLLLAGYDLGGARASPRAARRSLAPERPPLRARSVLAFSLVLVPLVLAILFLVNGGHDEGSVMAGGGLMKPTLFRFDFAPYVKLESEIRTSDQTVMLFRTEGRAERWLLRRFVLSGYDENQGFFMTPGKGFDEYPATVPDSPETFPDPGYRGRQAVTQEYYFLTLDPSSLVSLNYPLRVAPLVNWKSSSFLRVYRVDSKVTRTVSEARQVTAPPVLPAPQMAFYTAGATDEEINALARQVTAGKTGYDAKVEAIDEYLRNNYLYSLKPGIAEDGNQLRHFLFVSRKGYCSYFAFAMALMCRGLGIPARVAVGFYVDPQQEVLNFYEVRAFQAHAWVEVWFGDLGWVEFDPTSTNLAPGEDLAPAPGPDLERLTKLIAEILNNKTEEEAQAATPPGVVGVASRLAAELQRIALVVARLWYVTLPVLYLLYLALRKLAPSLRGLLSGDPRRRVKAQYRLLLVRLAGPGLGRRPAESPLEHAARLQARPQPHSVSIEPFVAAYLKAAFGETFTAADLAESDTALRAAAGSYRAAVPLALRVLGALNPLAAGPRRA